MRQVHNDTNKDGLSFAIVMRDIKWGVTMKLLLALVFIFSSAQSFADSFEMIKNGKTYVCEQKHNSNPTLSLSGLCNMAKNGNGQTIYHSNGNVFTYNAGTKGATLYYDNGQVITYNAGVSGATWYYSRGTVLTYSAGTKGATWYYSGGSVITYSAGTAGATWYYENGSVMTYSGPEMSEQELAYPCDYIE